MPTNDSPARLVIPRTKLASCCYPQPPYPWSHFVLYVGLRPTQQRNEVPPTFSPAGGTDLAGALSGLITPLHGARAQAKNAQRSLEERSSSTPIPLAPLGYFPQTLHFLGEDHLQLPPVLLSLLLVSLTTHVLVRVVDCHWLAPSFGDAGVGGGCLFPLIVC